MMRPTKSIQTYLKAAVLLIPGLMVGVARGEVEFTSLASFGATNGANPLAGLSVATDGNFYGTTRAGGPFNVGTVFRLSSGGTLTSLASFDGTNGAYPKAALAQATNGGVVLFGTASSGGASNYGTVFGMTAGGGITPLVSFAGTNGANPQAGLVLVSDGSFRGTTYYGGTNDWPAGYGTVFQVTTNGQLTTVASFANDNGASPYGGVTPGAAGECYGTTQVGGAHGLGTIFKQDSASGLTMLVSFNNTNGAFPFARLVAIGGGTFYGTTYSGGGSNLGTVFRVTTNGGLTSLAAFVGTNGARPFGGLLLAGDGNLYGTTSQGGAYGLGTIYQMTTNGVLTTLFSFAGLNGDNPYGELVQGGDGNLYGTTANGGVTGHGTVFRLSLPPAVPPVPPVFGPTTLSGNTLTLSWSAIVGKSYQLQYQTNLNQTSWLNLGPVTPATNLLMTALDTPAPDPQRFYRVVLWP